VGTESVGGTNTTHIRAGINVAAFLSGLNTLLGKASALGVSSAIPTSISPATQSRIAGEVHNASFDVWTGNSDKTVRKLMIGLTLPVHGQLSTLLGGMSSAAITITMQYANLNQPQTITAPTNLAPYSQFTAKLQAILGAIQGAVGAAAGGSTTSGTGATGSGSGSGSGSSGGGSASQTTQYGQCILAAGNDVTKMQQCASLIGK
jgi:uncharacterized membrane protein YgcG